MGRFFQGLSRRCSDLWEALFDCLRRIYRYCLDLLSAKFLHRRQAKLSLRPRCDQHDVPSQFCGRCITTARATIRDHLASDPKLSEHHSPSSSATERVTDMAVPNPNPYPVGNPNQNPYPPGTPASQIPPGATLQQPGAIPAGAQPVAPAVLGGPSGQIAPASPAAQQSAPSANASSANLQVAMQIVATVLNDVNSLLMGKPVDVPLPAEIFSLGNITISIPATNIQVSYSASGAAPIQQPQQQQPALAQHPAQAPV